jgi:hypothetical protein
MLKHELVREGKGGIPIYAVVANRATTMTGLSIQFSMVELGRKAWF